MQYNSKDNKQLKSHRVHLHTETYEGSNLIVNAHGGKSRHRSSSNKKQDTNGSHGCPTASKETGQTDSERKESGAKRKKSGTRRGKSAKRSVGSQPREARGRSPQRNT